MALKFVVLSAFVAFAAAIPQYPFPSHPEYNAHPQYTFGYKVEDPLTGDFKTQTESRDGDVVHGRYSLIEPNGSERIVEYTADAINGFNAVVTNSAAGVISAPVADIAKVAPAPLAPVVDPKAVVPAAVKAGKPEALRLASPYGYAPYGYHGYPGFYGHPGYAGYAGYGAHPYGQYSPYNTAFHPRFY